jgi:Xaa-Pro aminopeptidase
VELDNHAAGLAPWSVVPVESVGPDLASRAAELLSASRDASRGVGLIGPISQRLASALAGRLGDVPMVRLDDAFRRSRLVKSAEELRWTRYGAAICDRAVEVFLESARPGLRDDELGAILTGAVAEVGGQVGICFLASSSMEAGGSPVPGQTWTRRRTSPGDLVMFELSAGYGGATGQVLRTVSLGDSPSPPIAELHALAESVFARLLDAIRPGLAVRALEAIGAEIEAAGHTIVDDLVHGYGGGYLPPVIRTPSTRRTDPGPGLLQAGMLLVLQPNITTRDGRFGVQTGELVAVTDTGGGSLHGAPRGLLRLGRAVDDPAGPSDPTRSPAPTSTTTGGDP